MTKTLEMVGITKIFPGVVANDKVDFSLNEGEVHGLLGENGAGKTTLMNILYGLYDPDGGEIRINGKAVTIEDSHDAISLGIGMVHQHFQFVPKFTVAENFMLGMESSREPLLENRESVYSRIRKFSQEFQLPVDPSRVMWQLSVGQQQRVEILRALYRGAEILILDEPTSVLTPQEVEQLASIFENLVKKGKSVIFISHKLEEVMMMTHRVTVMRDGKNIGTVDTEDTSRKKLAHMMVGREIKSVSPKEKVESSDVPVLKVEDLCVNDDRKLSAVKNTSITVNPGEILGIAGVDGNGQTELEEAIIGTRPIIRGNIFLDGKDITRSSVWFRRRFLAYIPSDRYLKGLVSEFSVAENSVFGKHKKVPFSNSGLLNHNSINEHSEKLVKEYQIQTPDIKTKSGKLSGGNAQRLILAREISSEPKAILACQPTRGLDVGAKQYIHEKLLEERNSGVGILLISTDLEEILTLSDRIAVIYEGEIMDTISAENAHVERLGMLMAGSVQ